MMAENDEWGMDPNVQIMRRVFNRMEVAQREFLVKIDILPFDERLRYIRENARDKFEQVWQRYCGYVGRVAEKEVGDLYLHCLISVLHDYRIKVPEGVLPSNAQIEKIVKQVLG